MGLISLVYPRQRRLSSVAIGLTAALLGPFFCTPSPAQSRSDPSIGKRSDQQKLQIPIGTVLPARLNRGFSSKKTHPGQGITARIMQDVPLPDGRKIQAGSRLLGTILSVSPAGQGTGARVSFRFDRLEIHHRQAALVASLRALASLLEVEFAQIPETSPGFGTPFPWVTTHQVGGDVVYGVGGEVTDQWSRTVGKGVADGVLVHVRAQPGTECRGPLDDEDRLQALWVFSSDACGVYGMPGVMIAHAGRTDPAGEIVLKSENGNINVRGGSGLLLRVLQEAAN